MKVTVYIHHDKNGHCYSVKWWINFCNFLFKNEENIKKYDDHETYLNIALSEYGAYTDVEYNLSSENFNRYVEFQSQDMYTQFILTWS